MIDKAKIMEMLQNVLPEDINIEILLRVETTMSTKFQHNTVSGNTESQRLGIHVRAEQDGRVGSYSSNDLTVSGLKDTVARARENSKQGRPGPLVLTGSTGYREMEIWHPDTARQSAETRATLLEPVLSFANQANLEVDGVLSAQEGELAIVNSAGLAAWTQATFAEFRASVTGDDRAGLGHGYCCARNAAKLDILSPVLEASAKCQASSNPRPLPSGEYTVILEPAAVADLVAILAQTVFNGQVWSEKLSSVTKIGAKVFGDNITIWDDGLDPRGLAVPFDFEGVPKHKLSLATRGVIQNIALDNNTASVLDLAGTGHASSERTGPMPANIFMEAGNAMLDDMISSTRKGILVSRLRNLAVLDSRSGLLTGVTGNGTLLIENGKLKAAVPSLRFVHNLIEAFNRVEMIGDSPRLIGGLWGGIRVPALKIYRFNITGCQTGQA